MKTDMFLQRYKKVLKLGETGQIVEPPLRPTVIRRGETEGVEFFLHILGLGCIFLEIIS